MGFSRQEIWTGLPFPAPGKLPDPEIELESPALQADSLPSEPPGKPEGRVAIAWQILFPWMAFGRVMGTQECVCVCVHACQVGID